MIEVQERSYVGKAFRPQSQLLVRENPEFVVVMTSWGESDESDRILQYFDDQMKLEDVAEDLTTPMGRVDSLSHEANQLRSAAFLANDYLFRDVNRSEYLSCVEILALSWKDKVLSWVQVGSPSLLLRAQGQIQPLAYQISPSWIALGNSPLPAQALGLARTCNMSCGSLHIPGAAELLMVSRSFLPSNLFQVSNFDLPSVTEILVRDSEQEAFWAGSLRL